MTWLVENWAMVVALLSGLISLLNAVTSASPEKLKWLKHVVAWLSFLKSADAPGTLKLPLTREKK